MPCRPKHGSKCESCHTAHRDEILSTARPSCSYRAGTTQNISCRAVLWVVPNDRAAARPKMARPSPSSNYDHDDTSTTNTTSLPSPRHLPCFHAGHYLRSSTKSSYVQIREWCIPTHCVVGLDCGRCGGNNSDSGKRH